LRDRNPRSKSLPGGFDVTGADSVENAIALG
jgi:hypothetical protein